MAQIGLFLIYFLVGLIVYECAKRLAPDGYADIVMTFPEVEPYLPIIMGFIWAPLVLIALVTIIFDNDKSDETF